VSPFTVIKNTEDTKLTIKLKLQDPLYLLENTFDRKRIYANTSSNPNYNSNFNPKAQSCFRTDEMTSFFEQVYRYQNYSI